MIRVVLLAAFSACAFTEATNAQTTIFVPADHATIQAAIDASQSGDTVLVGPGIWVENLDLTGKGIDLQSTHGSSMTTLDGGAAGSVIRTGGGGSFATSVQSFTITNGAGSTTAQPGLHGGGILHDGGGELLVGDCLITGNGTPSVTGGGARCPIGQATFDHCTFDGNVAATGGAIHGSNAITLLACVIENNVSSAFAAVTATFTTLDASACVIRDNTGGGIYTIAGGATFTGCVVENNTGYGYLADVDSYDALTQCAFRGNAIGVEMEDAGPSFTDCDIENNLGHGVVIQTSQGHFDRCRVVGNGDSGIRMTGNPLPFVGGTWAGDFHNCLIAGNSATVGGGVYASGAQALFFGCTITDNSAQIGGGALVDNLFSFLTSGKISMRNCIVAGNTGPYELWEVGPALFDVGHCVLALAPGSNPVWLSASDQCITAPPVFFDAANGDFRLGPGSPAINSGVGTGHGTTTDLDGAPRVRFGRVDIGAYETGSPGLGPCAAGQVGADFGGPWDVLAINGSTGDAGRRVAATSGMPLTIDIANPPSMPQGADFTLWAVLDVATPAGGPPSLCFTPFISAPTVLLANSFAASQPAGAFTAVAAPWTRTFAPGLTYPVAITIQGLIEHLPAVPVATNAVLLTVEP